MAKKKENKLKSKLTKKFRLVVLNDASFEERFSFKLTRLNVFVVGGVLSILLIAFTVLLIAFTPIKEYIPGFSSTQLKKQATDLFYRVDSLQLHLAKMEKYTQAMKPILIGKEVELIDNLPYPSAAVQAEFTLTQKSHNTDSLQKVVETIEENLRITWQAHAQKSQKKLQESHDKKMETLRTNLKDSLFSFIQNYQAIAKEKNDTISQLKLGLLASAENNLALQKEISLKEIEVKNAVNALSKENQKLLKDTKKASEELKKEWIVVLQKEFKEKEEKQTRFFQKEIQALNQSIFAKKAVIDSLLFQIARLPQIENKETTPEKNYELSKDDSLLIANTQEDLLFREQIEREDRFSLFDFESDKADAVFYAPVKGILTHPYNAKEKHFAVDIAVANGTAVKSVADGTIIFAGWTAETGYVILIEHTNNYLSVYKHNEIVYRAQGDLVQTGEVIAVAGSSGEFSTGPHLHFEMWYQGYPVNPTNFIEFE
jgi:murein DD-endopeptidase MepM/ murein hydrolase activator NlpD